MSANAGATQNQSRNRRVACHSSKRAELSVEDYLKSLLGVTPERSRTPFNLDEFLADMESLAEDGEPLPRDFARADIYFSEG